MGGLGWQNPFPLELGGGRTGIELVHRAMRSNVGIGGSGPEDGLEDLWRQARAYGIAAAFTADERAFLQYFPNRATDALPYYEQLLLVPLSPGLEVHEKQELLAARFTAAPASSTGEVEAELVKIDERFQLLTIDEAETEVTVPGRAFEDLAASEPFNGGRRSSRVPNYSTRFLVIVLLDLQGDPFDADAVNAITRGRAYLNTALPAWVMMEEVTAVGFILDEDLLDLTAL